MFTSSFPGGGAQTRDKCIAFRYSSIKPDEKHPGSRGKRGTSAGPLSPCENRSQLGKNPHRRVLFGSNSSSLIQPRPRASLDLIYWASCVEFLGYHLFSLATAPATWNRWNCAAGSCGFLSSRCYPREMMLGSKWLASRRDCLGNNCNGNSDH